MYVCISVYNVQQSAVHNVIKMYVPLIVDISTKVSKDLLKSVQYVVLGKAVFILIFVSIHLLFVYISILN
jgi:hypothetical protein